MQEYCYDDPSVNGSETGPEKVCQEPFSQPLKLIADDSRLTGSSSRQSAIAKTSLRSPSFPRHAEAASLAPCSTQRTTAVGLHPRELGGLPCSLCSLRSLLFQPVPRDSSCLFVANEKGTAVSPQPSAFSHPPHRLTAEDSKLTAPGSAGWPKIVVESTCRMG